MSLAKKNLRTTNNILRQQIKNTFQEICTTLIELKGASMTLKQEIFANNKKIFDCDVRLALLNSSGKPEKFSIDLNLNIEKFFKFSQKKIGE